MYAITIILHTNTISNFMDLAILPENIRAKQKFSLLDTVLLGAHDLRICKFL
jgi:hypothetical protein